MTVYKYYTNKQKSKTKWFYIVDVPANDFDRCGNPKRKQEKKMGFNTRKEALEAERKFLQNLDSSKIELNKNAKFQDVISMFFDYIENEGKYSKGTIANYKGYYNNHLQAFKELTVPKITPIFIRTWHKQFHNNGGSDHVYNGCIKLAKRAFNYCKELNYVSTNPFKNIKPISVPKKLRKRFSTSELRNILETCRNKMPYFYCIFAIATLTGMREGEYSALRPMDITVYENIIKANVDKQFTNSEYKDRTKTEGSTREVTISPMVYSIIQWHINEFNIKPEDFLYKAEKGGMIYAKWVERKFQKLLKLCGYPEDYCRVHDLRGQYVDIMHLCGTPIEYISRQVGHSSSTVTSKVYTEILNELPVEATKRMDSLVFGNYKENENDRIQ